MATDEMIQLVAMYPDVWFMDTTAGKSFCMNLFFSMVSCIKWIHLFNEFI